MALATLVLLPGVKVLAPVAATVTQAGAGRVVLQPHDGSAPVELAVPKTTWTTGSRSCA